MRSRAVHTRWSPHLNLPGRPRLQRVAFEERIEVMPSSQQNVSARRQFRETQQTSASSCAATDTSIQIPDPQIPKHARPLSPAEREDSFQKCKRPAVVNTVLAIASGDNRIEISTLTDDQNALHPEKVNELLNMDELCVVEVFDRSKSQQVL